MEEWEKLHNPDKDPFRIICGWCLRTKIDHTNREWVNHYQKWNDFTKEYQCAADFILIPQLKWKHFRLLEVFEFD